MLKFEGFVARSLNEYKKKQKLVGNDQVWYYQKQPQQLLRNF